MKNLEVLLAE